MLDHFKQQGIDALELELRTSFTNKMVANQERTIVEQTIRYDFWMLSQPLFRLHLPLKRTTIVSYSAQVN